MLRIVRALAIYRPSLIALLMPLSIDDEVWAEKCFQRSLLVRPIIIIIHHTFIIFTPIAGTPKTHVLQRDTNRRLATYRRDLPRRARILYPDGLEGRRTVGSAEIHLRTLRRQIRGRILGQFRTARV